MATRKLNLKRSAIEHHKQIGKELVPPFQQVGPRMDQIFWLRDLLPEFLWIDSLLHAYAQPKAVAIFNDFLTAADRFNTHPTRILDGTVSAFRLIPIEHRQDFVAELHEIIEAAVVNPFRHLLSVYADCPMTWVAPNTPIDCGVATEAARQGFLRLMPGKDKHAGLCRALPLNRFFAHNKVHISADLKETIEAIKQYPHGDRYRAESFARNMHNMQLMHEAEQNPDMFAWARSFWNTNRNLVPCSYE